MFRLGQIVIRRFFAASLVPKQWGFLDDYEILSNLGKGSSARIFMGNNVVSGEKVVIKIFKQLPADSIRKEISINLQLKSNLTPSMKNVEFIHLLDTCYDYSSSAFTLIYQFFPGVPLNQLISTISLPNSLKYVLVLAHTLKYVHSLGLIHRDIKPANVLITPKGPKLFDFGLTKKIDQSQTIKTNNFGTKCYKTPQVIYRMDTYNQSVDIWGLGLILAQCVLNKKHLLPYQSDQSMLSQIASLCSLQPSDANLFKAQLLNYIQIQKSRSWSSLAQKNNVNPAVIHLVKGMLEINPANRPSLDQIINHQAFKGVQL